MQFFKESTVSLGDVRAGSSNVPVKWEFQDIKKEDIAVYDDGSNNQKFAVQAGCGCTDVTVVETGIEAKYNNGGNVTGSVTKSVTVYLKTEGEDNIRIPNGKGGFNFNPNLRKVKLYFTANIV